jgi:UV DNA damage endonuclease
VRLGYPCINYSIGCKAGSKFRLGSYSEERMYNVVKNNLTCLQKILQYNLKHDFLFFRISSDIVPFASHPICKFNWIRVFREEFESIGNFIKNNNMRISMHPGQYILLNAKDEKIRFRSIAELTYHCNVLDSLGLDESAKIQIHIGGAYGDKVQALTRFVNVYELLEPKVRRRLVIENDDRLFSLKDCLDIHALTGIPIVFDTFHHRLLNNGESLSEAIQKAGCTWDKKHDGLLMMDYSEQEVGERLGVHSYEINIESFIHFLQSVKEFDFDLMLEIKDKEKSALQAKPIIDSLPLKIQSQHHV